MDVPLMYPYPPSNVVERIAEPGAATVTEGPKLEKFESWSAEFVEATETTCAQLPGCFAPSAVSLPAAATMTTPLAHA
jgi:hypothetical protein